MKNLTKNLTKKAEKMELKGILKSILKLRKKDTNTEKNDLIWIAFYAIEAAIEYNPNNVLSIMELIEESTFDY